MILVSLVAILWSAVEFCHWISILGYLSSFLSMGALGDFVGHANLTAIRPACDSCCECVWMDLIPASVPQEYDFGVS
ncbi:hypothetical protein T484DRAFT_1977380 [Baffinella frigidus]|nr:hypothetical protein T484DRAFT_1977380 [Cryptophyta sp. CCMP2293]